MNTIQNFTDFDTVSHVLEQIGKERNWKKEDIANDVDILNLNRVYRVNDLKALSSESWRQIALLPLVKDLLRSCISSPNYVNNKKGNNSNKKKEKKAKEEKGKGFVSPSTLGSPVVPTVIKAPPLSVEQEEEDVIAHDQLTVQNTILNGVSASSTTEEEDNPSSDNSSGRRKSVTFSNETTIGVAASEKKKEKKKKKDNKKKKDKTASINKNNSEYLNFKSHPYNATYPIIKFRKMKMKHCKRLPPVPANDPFLQRIHDKLTLASSPT